MNGGDRQPGNKLYPQHFPRTTHCLQRSFQHGLTRFSPQTRSRQAGSRVAEEAEKSQFLLHWLDSGCERRATIGGRFHSWVPFFSPRFIKLPMWLVSLGVPRGLKSLAKRRREKLIHCHCKPALYAKRAFAELCGGCLPQGSNYFKAIMVNHRWIFILWGAFSVLFAWLAAFG